MRANRALLVVLGGLAAAACGASGDATAVPRTGQTKDSITFGAASLTVVPGGRASVAPSIADAPVAGSTIRWSTSNAAVAQVFGDGTLHTFAPGTATITAQTTSGVGSYVVHVADTLQFSDFRLPLPRSVSTSTVFDHDLPIGFADANDYSLSYWGEKLHTADHGHQGYDWPVPVGTPVMASAAGVVLYAQADAASVCPLLNNQIVSGNSIIVAHGLADGRAIETSYGHLSRIDVQYGDRVEPGQQLGLSGSTGCSTGPHLHFSMALGSIGNGDSVIVFDPHGWSGPGADPWAVNPHGITSPRVWGDSTVPIYRELALVGVFASPSPVVMTLVHYMGVDDAHHPNNEYVDLAANPSFGDADLSGLVLRNTTGAAYSIPSGIHVAAGSAIRVYSGVGANSATALYMNRGEPMWNDELDCAELARGSTAVFNAFWGGGSSICPGLAAASIAAPPPPRDLAPDAATLLNRMRAMADSAKRTPTIKQ